MLLSSVRCPGLIHSRSLPTAVIRRAAFQTALLYAAVAYFLGIPDPQISPGASSPTAARNEALSPRGDVYNARPERSTVRRPGIRTLLQRLRFTLLP